MNKNTMTKEQFKKRWESNDSGGGITFEAIADCATAWGISQFPRTRPIDSIRYAVLKAAKTVDAEEFNPDKFCDSEEDNDEYGGAK